MRGHSDDLAAALSQSHTATIRVDVLRDGKVVRQLDIHAGSVNADATAAQRTSFEIEVADPDGDLTPVDMSSLLAPFGSRIQVWRGVRLQNEVTHTQFSNTAASWAVSGSGVLNSVLVDGDGALSLFVEGLMPDTTLYPSTTLYPEG